MTPAELFCPFNEGAFQDALNTINLDEIPSNQHSPGY